MTLEEMQQLVDRALGDSEDYQDFDALPAREQLTKVAHAHQSSACSPRSDYEAQEAKEEETVKQLDPKEAVSCHLHLRRCPGRLASGNRYKCHPNHEPGGYDIGFMGYDFSSRAPFATFEEAKEELLMLQEALGRLLEYDRTGRHVAVSIGPEDLKNLREVDVFDDAYILAEEYLSKYADGAFTVIGEDRKCRFGWLVRYDTKKARKKWSGKKGWYAWEGDSFPEGPHLMLLVVPPKGTIYRLSVQPTLEATLKNFSESHPEVEPCYPDNPDYDTLVNAGVEPWRASSALHPIKVHIEIALNAYRHGDFDPRFAEAARVILERCAAQAKEKDDT